MSKLLTSFILSMNIYSMSMTKQPIKMTINILIIMIISMPTLFYLTKSSWFPFLLIMTILSGLMMIFLFMSTSANNTEKKKNMSFISLIMILLFSIMLSLQHKKDMTLSMLNFSNVNFTMSDMSSIFINNMSLTIIMFLYLILTMLITNKLIKDKKKPLRNI